MRLKYCDTHTSGEPTRIVYDGFPELEGKSMIDKKNYLAEEFEEIRTMTMLEPRGHENMFGAIVTEPVNQEADKGVIFMDTGGYLNMCGHGSMGVATFLVEAGLVEKKEPVTKVILDSPAGLIRTKVYVDQGLVQGVSIINVPSFLYKEDLNISTKNLESVKVDISYGGNFFALVDVAELGLELSVENADLLKKYSMEIRDRINEVMEVRHPIEDIEKVDLVEIYEKPQEEDNNYRNVVVFGAGQLDRSPCGTGTSAKLASLYKKGEIGLGERFVYESIIGSKFSARALEEINVGGYKGIVPEVKGRAFLIAKGEVISNREDNLDRGFLI